VPGAARHARRELRGLRMREPGSLPGSCHAKRKSFEEDAAMKSTEIEQFGTALFRGEITQDKFVRATSHHWRRLALDLYRRWRKKLPPSVEFEDVEQEFLMQVLAHLPQWDASAGMPISKFVSWAATKRTQREIHKMRGARIHGNEGKNKGRPETTFTAYSAKRASHGSRDGRPEDVDPCDLVPLHATQDVRAALREVLSDALVDAVTVREAFVMLALKNCDGDPDDAAAKLFESFSARVECELRDVEHARRVVTETIHDAMGAYIHAA